jgi:hypothetical protein
VRAGALRAIFIARGRGQGLGGFTTSKGWAEAPLSREAEEQLAEDAVDAGAGDEATGPAGAGESASAEAYAAELAEVGEPPLEEPLSVTAQIRAAVAMSVVSPAGYVRCTQPPWDGRAVLGRVTSWPASVPEALRSCSMRCYAHPRCSLARPRRATTNEALIEWLLHGALPPISEAPTPAAQASMHMDLWRSTMSAGEPVDPGSAAE